MALRSEHRNAANWFDLERDHKSERKVIFMVWLLIAVSIYAVIFVAGRAHSRYLDRLEARRKMVVTIQLFDVSPDIVKETEFAADVTSDAFPIESINSFSVRNQNETCVRPPEADDRSINDEICPVPDEAKLCEACHLPQTKAAVGGVATITNGDEEKRQAKNGTGA
jgi:hypothetical protein